MKTLYFDLDGTLLNLETGYPKGRLVSGAFERAVRSTKIERMVCMGNLLTTLDLEIKMGIDLNRHEVISELCEGMFLDFSLFESTTGFVTDPGRRAAEIDFRGDWWYLDDLAYEYFGHEGMEEAFREHSGKRIFVPDPIGDGADILEWLKRISD